LTAVLAADVSHGTLTLSGTGSFSYKPTSGFSGNDSFTYQAFDGSLSSNTAAVNILVRAPVCPGDSFACDYTDYGSAGHAGPFPGRPRARSNSNHYFSILMMLG